MNHANDNRPIAVSSNGAGEPLRFLSVCSGIEAASVAWPQWQAVAFSEIEKFPSAVLAHHYPGVPNLGDFTKIDTATLGRVDILAGGTPCQAFSVAGLRGGLNDERGNLSLKFVELAHALADGNGLRNVVWENVVGVLSDKGNAFGCFLAGLVGADAAIEPPTRGKWGGAGLVAGPKGRASWRVCDAQYWGVAQRRRRVIVVADFGIGADPAAVLFVEEGLRRDTPPRRETGKGVAGTIAGGAGGGGAFGLQGNMIGRHDDAGPLGAGHQEELSYTLTKADVHGVAYAPEIARCDATREGSSQDYETTTMLAVSVTGEVAHTRKAEGADAREDGTGRGTPIVCVHGTQDPCTDEHRAFALGRNCGQENAVLSVAIRGREGGATAELGGEVATALRASQGGGDKPHVLAAMAFTTEQTPKFNEECALTLTKQSPTGGGQIQSVTYGSAVRRLTPVECERLQGFPDGYTAIPWRGKPASECPDGPRYKALGNSWAVPLFTWLGKRIDMHMPPVATHTTNKDTRLAA